MQHRRLWIAFGAVVVLSLVVLGYFGRQIYRQAPPIPSQVVDATGRVLFTGQEIRDGQNVWQSIGGQEVGSIWGHGAYVAPDWSADWLHREAVALLDQWAAEEGAASVAALPAERQAALRERLRTELRANRYEPASGRLPVSTDRARAIEAVAAHYTSLFSDDPALASLRDAYAIPPNSISDPARRHLLTAFFFWASWSCVTERPGSDVTYSNNWPPEPLVANRPSGPVVLWSVISIILLIAGVGGLVWYNAAARRRDAEESEFQPALRNPLAGLQPTASMRATLKYFWVAAALLVTQVLLGAITAHYGVEGNGFYGIPLAKWVPYAVARTWHVQLGIFWIATAWLATGLFVAPAVAGHEPRFQRFGVNFLFTCLLVIVVGSLTGQWLAIRQKLGLVTNFWFGHQGYEYVDLGRFWQIFLFVGLFVWLGLMVRALWPALRRPSEHRGLLAMFAISSAAIAAFYGAGLMWGRQTHLSMAEYWRWWVVHLWVEGFFEVFATTVLAFLFTRLGLIRLSSATRGVLLSTVTYLGGGMIGTFHHLYFTGTPTSVLALGSVFSALEIVPLVLVGAEAVENLGLLRLRDWVASYRWPIYFFVAVAFWNLLGAGVFGFLINPPVALYYMQGLNTTAVHGHAALFGVYGMLGIGLLLFCLRHLHRPDEWRSGPLAYAFWSINIGLGAMVLLSLLPVGLAQTWASLEHGMWYARSAEFLQQPVLQRLRWMRVIGDTIFSSGILVLGWFVIGLQTGWSYAKPSETKDATWAPAPSRAR